MFCPACNIENEADAIFCKHCGASISAGGASATGKAPVFAGGDSNYSLTMTDLGPNKIDVIKLIREIMSASLVDAKNAVDPSGGTLHTGLSPDVANQIAERLRAAGATVSVAQSGLDPGGAAPKFQVTFKKSFKVKMNNPGQPTDAAEGFDAPDSGARSTGIGPVIAFLVMIGMAVLGYFVYLSLAYPAK